MPVSSKDYVVLEILAIQGRNLPNKDFFKKQDPFLQFTIGKNSHKTKVDKNGGTRPEWNSRIRFERLPTPVNDMLRIKCLDSEWKREPQFIGECVVDLAPVFVRGEEDSWFKLTDKGEPADGLTRRQSKIGGEGVPISISSAYSKPLPDPVSLPAATQVATSSLGPEVSKPLPEIKVQKTQSASHTPSASITSTNAISSSWSSPGLLNPSSPSDSSMANVPPVLKPEVATVGSSNQKIDSDNQQGDQFSISNGEINGHVSGNSGGSESQTLHTVPPVNGNLGTEEGNEIAQPPSIQPVPDTSNNSIPQTNVESTSNSHSLQESSIVHSLAKISLNQETSSISPTNESGNALNPNKTDLKLSPKKKFTIEAILGRQSDSDTPPKPPITTANKPSAGVSNVKAQPEQSAAHPPINPPSEPSTAASQEVTQPSVAPAAIATVQAGIANSHVIAPAHQNNDSIVTTPLQTAASSYSSATHNVSTQQEATPSAPNSYIHGAGHVYSASVQQDILSQYQPATSVVPQASSDYAQTSHAYHGSAYPVPTSFAPTGHYSPPGNNHPVSMSYQHGSIGSQHQAPPGNTMGRPEGSYQPPPEVPYPPSSFNPRPMFQATPYPPPSFPVGGFAFGNQEPSQYPTGTMFPNHLNYIPQPVPYPHPSQWPPPQTFPSQPLPPPLPTKPHDMPSHYVHDTPPPLPSRISGPPPIPPYQPQPPPSSSHNAHQQVPVLNPNNFKPSSQPSSSSSSLGKKKKKSKLGFLFS
ncbi:hypothetical protein DSO57_1011684 [Entomophthora muscae]|uniref:Uncharacterized protein n=1 Tax=Entomophthora muscae TaxID=34485 RepID=A0ACC2TTV9_9FUNG|nr:hypothetical protein DSO57_1011684 [Entomophthora muscae]